MKYCNSCGASMPDEARFCPSCRSEQPVMQVGPNNGPRSFYNNASSGNTFQPASGSTAGFGGGPSFGIAASEPDMSGKDILINGMKLSENEVVVKKYNCCKMLLPRVSGWLTITNKRVIYQGISRNSITYQETSLDGVSGINCSYGLHFRWLLILVGIIGLVEGIRFSDSYFMDAFSAPLIIASLLVLVLFGVRRTYSMNILSAAASSPISLGRGVTSLVGNAAIFSFIALATSDTKAMINEAGALIMDLKSNGDLAVEKWKK